MTELATIVAFGKRIPNWFQASILLALDETVNAIKSLNMKKLFVHVIFIGITFLPYMILYAFDSCIIHFIKCIMFPSGKVTGICANINPAKLLNYFSSAPSAAVCTQLHAVNE